LSAKPTRYSRELTTSRSTQLYERALELMPGGVNSPVRAMRAVGREPLFIESASGAELVDVDGNRFIDYVCSWGPLIAGHAHPDVVAAVTAAAERGTSYGAPTEAEVELAEQVVSRVPSAKMVRLTSSGTEATMTAIRLARSATSRDKVLKFAGAYHGHVDGLLADAGSGLATQGIPASPGVTRGQTADTLVCGWNDSDGFEALVDASGAELAAVIAEPLPANMGVVPPAQGFLELLRSRCEECGALLILDEVISGFRVARGGAQELYRLTADITVLGKVLGGGLPLAAVAGPRSLMDRLAPAGDTYQAGTLSGNPLATSAGLATLALLTPDAYARLGTLTTRLVDGLRDAATQAGARVQVTAACGLLTVFFSERPVESYEHAKDADAAAFARFHGSMLDQGIYLPPSAFEAWFPSLAHTDDHIGRTIEAAAAAFEAA
jgi:glutamate-1-semialdehyde 2,1-aminomutase